MSHLLLDAFDDAAPWSAFEADGVTPSAALGLSIDTQVFHLGEDAASGRIDAAVEALGHFLRRSFVAVDLSQHDELRFWLRASRAADGTPERPFFLELRAGSAALPIGDPQNTWQRFLPVAKPGAWELACLALDDLPAAVRGALTRLELRCTHAAQPFTCHLDDLAAVREEMIGDVEAALVARLDGRLSLAGAPVVAQVASAGVAAPAAPYIRIALVEIRTGGDRPRPGEVRRDYSGLSYRIAAAANEYDLTYDIDAVTTERAHTTRILEFVLASLAPRAQLAVAGRPGLLDWLPIERSNLAEDLDDDRVRLRFRIAARQAVGRPKRVTPAFNEPIINTDSQGSPT